MCSYSCILKAKSFKLLMRKYNLKYALAFVSGMAILWFFTYHFICVIIMLSSDVSTQDDYPTVIWWTSLIPNYDEVQKCGNTKCLFTDNKELLNSDRTKAILYYGSNMNYTNFAVPRLPHHIWGLLHEESPKNLPFLQNDIILKYFNYTSTFSRYSDLPLTLQYLQDIELLTSTQFVISVQEKNAIKRREKLAPIAFLQSHCDTPSGRDEYVNELMNFIDIDSYGECLNNKKLPESLTENYLETIYSDELYKLLAQYKFVMAFENAVCNDYITEKLWRPLIIGSIPIYFGSPTIQDWLPTNKSALLIKDFASPEALANFVKYLDENDEEYNKYLHHKYSTKDPIQNINLASTFNSRRIDNIFLEFQCFVCEKIANGQHVASVKDYDCGDKLIFPKMDSDLSSFYWHDIMNTGKCEAIILDEFLAKNREFTNDEFEINILEALNSGVCEI